MRLGMHVRAYVNVRVCVFVRWEAVPEFQYKCASVRFSLPCSPLLLLHSLFCYPLCLRQYVLGNALVLAVLALFACEAFESLFLVG